ncbi:MAG TPA: triose-phosphate isomerase [Candidatus Paceibacterota bacterium]|nr:triose-phosphate isomerase [Candidatus Paceibacterota bacterium]
MSRRKKIIVGNWKMNPESLREAVRIFSKIKKSSSRLDTEIIICPPAIYLNNLTSGRIKIGAQDVSAETKGAHTGEISAEMLAKNNIKYVIVGHSERRSMGETDEIINKKIETALFYGLKIILCVGESKRDEHGEYLNYLKSQLKNSLKRINRKYLKNILIAYEPLFTIGRKDFEAMSPHDIHQIVILIRKNLLDHFSDPLAAKVPILYGGSVSVENAALIVEGGEVNGLLIGRQSLNPEQFGEIIRRVARV